MFCGYFSSHTISLVQNVNCHLTSRTIRFTHKNNSSNSIGRNMLRGAKFYSSNCMQDTDKCWPRRRADTHAVYIDEDMDMQRTPTVKRLGSRGVIVRRKPDSSNNQTSMPTGAIRPNTLVRYRHIQNRQTKNLTQTKAMYSTNAQTANKTGR